MQSLQSNIGDEYQNGKEISFKTYQGIYKRSKEKKKTRDNNKVYNNTTTTHNTIHCCITISETLLLWKLICLHV